MWQKATLLVLLTLSFKAMAKDFGVQGEVFEIGEPDMLEYIESKLKQMESEGQFESINKHMLARTEGYVKRPPAVHGIVHTQEPRTWEYDTSYMVTEDIRDQDGDVIHPKGTAHNALEHVSLGHDLVFIDGDDNNKQVAWALAKAENFKQGKGKSVKIILINGEPFELMKKHQVRIYFDQQGILTTKLGITQVPALVSQKGIKLLVQELKVEGR